MWLTRFTYPAVWDKVQELAKEKYLLLKRIDQLTIENNDLKEKNKKCQENINKTNAHWKGITGNKSPKRKPLL